MHNELVQKMPELQRVAVKYGNAALYRDLEKYRETPEVALFKHHSFNSFVQMKKERERQKEEEEESETWTRQMRPRDTNNSSY